MDSSRYLARRATLDDLPALKGLWEINGLPALELERHLTEFQLVTRPDGIILGAIALRVSGTQALIHSESVYPGQHAEDLRPLAWRRLQVLARNQRVTRLWLRGQPSPSWTDLGFLQASPADLKRLPHEFGADTGSWGTHSLLDERVLDERFEKELVMFHQAAESNNERLRQQALWLKRLAALIAFGFLAGAFVLLYQIVSKRARRSR